ncbi:transposase, partial [Bacillus thuringiensis]|nr:transposase [Bacillus thuringiensis]
NLIYQMWKKKHKFAHHTWHLDETYIKVKGKFYIELLIAMVIHWIFNFAKNEIVKQHMPL